MLGLMWSQRNSEHVLELWFGWASVHCWVLRGRPVVGVVLLWAVVVGIGLVWWWWWSAGVVVKCRVDASIFFLDL